MLIFDARLNCYVITLYLGEHATCKDYADALDTIAYFCGLEWVHAN